MTDYDEGGEYDGTQDEPRYLLLAREAEMLMTGGFHLNKDPQRSGEALFLWSVILLFLPFSSSIYLKSTFPASAVTEHPERQYPRFCGWSCDDSGWYKAANSEIRDLASAVVEGAARSNPVTRWVTSKQPSLLLRPLKRRLLLVFCVTPMTSRPYTTLSELLCNLYVGHLSLRVVLGDPTGRHTSRPSKHTEEPSAATHITLQLEEQKADSQLIELCWHY